MSAPINLDRLWSVGAKFLSFAAAHWRLLGAMSLGLCVFFWTNWYFSPTKRLERLAERALHSAAAESDRDRGKLMEVLKIRAGGPMISGSSCSAGGSCEITVTDYYLVDHKEKKWRLQVRVTLTPILPEPSALSFLPQTIDWTVLGRQWSVAILDTNDSKNNLFYSGNWSQFNQVPSAEGVNVISPLLNAIAIGMQRELQR